MIDSVTFRDLRDFFWSRSGAAASPGAARTADWQPAPGPPEQLTGSQPWAWQSSSPGINGAVAEVGSAAPGMEQQQSAHYMSSSGGAGTAESPGSALFASHPPPRGFSPGDSENICKALSTLSSSLHQCLLSITPVSLHPGGNNVSYKPVPAAPDTLKPPGHIDLLCTEMENTVLKCKAAIGCPVYTRVPSISATSRAEL
ncbi:hypothetical protein UY3_02191 [Chelonia mydas]|uniref:Uncharacterized protein n=1 Tax=Chelonia mydas TaxID=8469 RepID=M7BRR6_CHEMY|nr:hypothetical protein UY3_02191 [Chelonia mydas]